MSSDADHEKQELAKRDAEAALDAFKEWLYEYWEGFDETKRWSTWAMYETLRILFEQTFGRRHRLSAKEIAGQLAALSEKDPPATAERKPDFNEGYVRRKVNQLRRCLPKYGESSGATVTIDIEKLKSRPPYRIAFTRKDARMSREEQAEKHDQESRAVVLDVSHVVRPTPATEAQQGPAQDALMISYLSAVSAAMNRLSPFLPLAS